MPSSLTAAMEIEARDHVNRLHPVVEFTFGGVVYRFAEESVASENKGTYLPYIQERGMGTKRRGANVAEFSLEAATLSVSIYDADRVLQKLFGGPLRGSIKQSKVEVWWRSFGGDDNAIALADHYLDFLGVVDDYDVTDRVFSFRCVADMSGMVAPAKIPPWPQEDWPNAPDTTIGSPNRVIYGYHLSTGVPESFGMIKCVPLKLETNGNVNEWGVSYGACKAVTAVYNGQTIATSNFAASKELRGKNYYQIIKYTSGGTQPTKTSDIKVDVEGLTTKPDGTGTVITNPAEQMRHFLANFAYGTGDVRPFAAWASETGKPIATTIWDRAKDFFRYRGWTGSMIIQSGRTVQDVLTTWCQTFGAAPFFSDLWGIGALPRNNSEYVLYYDDRHAAQKLVRAKNLKLTTSRKDKVTDFQVNYLLDNARGVFSRAQLVAWRRIGVPIKEEDYNLTFGNSFAG